MNILVPAWPGLLWGMAMLGLLLLPSSYRAGAETAHAHSLVQLWIDATDGSIHHHDHDFVLDHHESVAPTGGIAVSWFDPVVDATPGGEDYGSGVSPPDVGEQQDSAPVSSGVDFLIVAVMTVVIAAAGRAAPVDPGRRPESRFPRLLIPPPRTAPVAAQTAAR